MDLTDHALPASSSARTTTAPAPTSIDRTTRSSARIKAAAAADKDTHPPTPFRPQKRPRDTKGKEKGKERDVDERTSKRQRRATIATASALTIDEPVRDPKGKKRAIEPISSDDETTRPLKRSRSSYGLRTRTGTATQEPSTSTTTTMTKTKSRAANKGKGAVSPAKAKAMAAAAAAGPSSRVLDDDPDMLSSDYEAGEEVANDDVDDDDDDEGKADAGHGDENRREETRNEEEHHDNDAGGGDGEEDGDDSDEDGDDDVADAVAPTAAAGNDAAPANPTEGSAPLSVFGDFAQFGNYMLNLSSRLRTMLNNIKPSADPTTRLITLQELSELLSISTEDTLSGSFQIDAYVKELVRILGGSGNTDSDGEGGNDAQDEDAALAAALAMSTGGFAGDENLEAQVLACRCLANMMEALPGTAHTVVYHGAIPVLCSKLIEIAYIDLAEQTLSTLEKISEEFPQAIVREGGLAALLNYLDFFSIAVQRTALQAASNCCRNVSSEYFTMVRAAWPTIRNCLSYSDQRLVEFASLCVVRVIDSYHRSSPTNLESLVDADLVRAVNMLLLPAGGSPLIASNTFTLFLKSLSLAARASAKIAVVLLEEGVVETLHQIFTGVLPPTSDAGEEQGGGEDGQGLGGGLADMAVMETLAHRPKEQVEAALELISELMPPMPRDGVFDHKGYTEKALARMVKAKAKADRAAAKAAASSSTSAAEPSASASTAPTAAPAESSSAAAAATAPPAPTDEATSQADSVMADALPGVDGGDDVSASPKEPIVDRKELLRSKPGVVQHFMRLIVPILIDVYAASVAPEVRAKTVNSLLKAISFLEADDLMRVLKFVPVASFAGSILSSRDNTPLVLGALELVEILLTKLPKQYKASFRREGVLYEIDVLSERVLTTDAKKEAEKDKEKEKDKDKDTSSTDGSNADSSASAAPSTSSSPNKKSSTATLDPDDAITLRARVIKFRCLSAAEEDGDDVFAVLRQLIARLSNVSASETEMSEALKLLADHFASAGTSVSSFELLQSGVVDGLLEFATSERNGVSVDTRQDLLLDAFGSKKGKEKNGQTPLALLVKKLQESLTRMESFDVISVAPGTDSKRSNPSLLARQLRLRLVASDASDIPRNFQNIVVSIHAIATFQALNDYLRPRVAGLLSSGSRLSGMLAALRAAQEASTSAPPPPTAALNAAPAAEPSTSASAPPPAQPRRSKRLSAKVSSGSLAGGEDDDEDDDAAAPPAPSGEGAAAPEHASASVGQTSPQSTAVGEPAPSDPLINEDEDHDDEDFIDDDVDAEMFDEEHENAEAEKTVNLAVAGDGDKVEAQTPDGTRIATPNPPKDGPAASTSAPLMKQSYAAALKAKPTDWHLEFSMDDQPLPLDLTIYGAIHQHETRKDGSSVPPSSIWQNVYTVTFKKVSGPAPTSEARPDGLDRSRSPTLSMVSLPPDAPHSKILRLLRVLHRLNVRERDRASHSIEPRSLPDTAFINNKLTAKLTRQLEEPMVVASSCLPEWAVDLPQHYPFLFPFATRYNFLQSTSFGYARLIMKWQTQHNRGQDNSRRDESFGFLGRLLRQKVRISRKHILESAVKVFELYGSSSSILEVEYFEEVGTGLGPTLEFYSLVSKEFARRDLKIWRDGDSTMPGPYVHHPLGLYPAPVNVAEVASDGGQKRTQILRVIGQFVAKAMLDSRIIDISFNKLFLKIVMGDTVPLTIANLKLVDPALANSLTRLEGYASQALVEEDPHCIVEPVEPRVNVEDLSLDFTIPGYDIELRPGGKDIPVTAANVHEYVLEVLDAIIGKGIQAQAKAFREGFSKVFPIGDLQAFSVDELVLLFGNSDEDWSIETLNEAIKADHGFNMESRAIRDLVEILSEFDQATRRNLLQFITGSPKLPIGGFRGLNPPLTVVRKPHEAPLKADDYLPSVMTCVNYLKLPQYSSKGVMREKLRTAMQEGVGSFHLS